MVLSIMDVVHFSFELNTKHADLLKKLIYFAIIKNRVYQLTSDSLYVFMLPLVVVKGPLKSKMDLNPNY